MLHVGMKFHIVCAISRPSEEGGGLLCFICKFPKLSSNVFPGSVAHFLESRGMVEEALEVATEPDYRFDLAIQLGKLDIAKVGAPNLMHVVWTSISSFKLVASKEPYVV